MNIFHLSESPIDSARMMCDKHVIKMILESTQMLCTTYHETNQSEKIKIIEKNVEKFYRSTHKNHPSTKWIRENITNFMWGWYHAKALCQEYTYRYGKTHKSENLLDEIKNNLPDLPKRKLTKFAMAMPDIYKRDDPIDAYRAYYIGEKLKFMTYKKREIPDFLRTYINNNEDDTSGHS